jgi:hypothetical protein
VKRAALCEQAPHGLQLSCSEDNGKCTLAHLSTIQNGFHTSLHYKEKQILFDNYITCNGITVSHILNEISQRDCTPVGQVLGGPLPIFPPPLREHHPKPVVVRGGGG